MTVETILLACVLLLVILLFVVIFQAQYVTKHAIRLPEASGVRSSIKNRQTTLLHMGESTVAGVGVESIEQGLTFSILENLSNNYGHELDWEILGLNGAKVADMLMMKPFVKCPDILILTFGVNDTKGFTTKAQWLKNLRRCVDKFSCETTKVYCTAVPPMHKFPLLPPPLRYLLGAKAKYLDNSLKKLCYSHNWVHIKPNLVTEPAPMAKDGFHPNAYGYKIWGEYIAASIIENSNND